jgi:hypothetical protein
VSSLVELLNDRTPLSPPFGSIVVVLALFGLAWLVGRAAGRLATFIVTRSERKHAPGIEDSGVIASLKQRETAISLARTTVRFLAYALAATRSGQSQERPSSSSSWPSPPNASSWTWSPACSCSTRAGSTSGTRS